MKLLYLECNMGAAGDMLMGALADLLPDREGFAARMNALGLPGVHVELRNAVKCGIVGTHAEVTVSGTEEESLEVPMQGHAHNHDHEHTHSHEHEHPHTHVHRGMAEIEAMIERLEVSEKVKEDVKNIYRIIAEADSGCAGRHYRMCVADGRAWRGKGSDLSNQCRLWSGTLCPWNPAGACACGCKDP